MFEILNHENPSVHDLAAAYLEMEGAKAQLNETYESALDGVIELQQQSMSGQKVATAIKSQKAELEDVTLKLESCRRGMASIREKLAEVIPVEAESRIQAIEAEQAALRKEKDRLFNNFLKKAAETLVLLEKITGPRMHYDRHHGTLQEALPKLVVEPYSPGMDNEKSAFFVDQVKAVRKKEVDEAFTPMDARIEAGAKELNRLKKLRSDYDPDVEVEKAIDALRPKVRKEAVSEIVFEGPVTTSPHTITYPDPPDYSG